MDRASPKETFYPELTSARSIRVLTLEPRPEGETHDSIHLNVQSVDLDQNPKYKALSYTWRDPLPDSADSSRSPTTETSTIKCDFINGKEFTPVPNLYSALCRLRLRYPGEAFWIDGICINQDDTVERNSQVSLMGDIYASATQVVVWLGEEDDDSRNAFKLIDRLGPFVERFIRQGRLSELRDFPFGDPAFYERYDLKVIGLDWWKSYVRFNRRTWFHRAWVIQEIALADEFVMLCGENEVRWDNLYYVVILTSLNGWDATMTALETDKRAVVGLYPGGLLRQMLTLSNELHHGEERPLVEKRLRRKDNAENDIELENAYFQYVLSIIRNFDSSEPHDKVYAALGLVEKFDSKMRINLPRPDYNLPVWEVYHRTTKFFIEHSNSLTILSYVNQGTTPKTPNLPSWVPDFSEVQFERLVDMGHGPDFDASLHIKSNNDPPVFLGRSLVIQAALCGVVNGTSERFDSPELLALLISCLNTCPAPHNTYRNGQSCFEALWRTMIADQVNGRGPAPSEFGSSFRQLLLYRAADYLAHPKAEDFKVIFRKAWASIEVFEKNHPGCNLPSEREVQNLLTRLKDGNLREIMECEAATKPFIQSQSIIGYNRKLFRTSGRSMGLCPESTKVGDLVYIVKGAKVPFIIRHISGDNDHQLVGEAYLHGFMHGEFVGSGEADFHDISLL